MSSFLATRSLWLRSLTFVMAHMLAVAILYLLLVAPLRAVLAERQDDLAQRRATLERYAAVVKQENAVRAYAKLVEDGNARGELLNGATTGIIDANLQTHLKSLAEQLNVTVRSIQNLPPKTLHGATLVGARLDVAAPNKALNALARALETRTPLLLVTAASIRGQANFWNAAAAVPGQTETSLEAEFDVYGGALAKEQP